MKKNAAEAFTAVVTKSQELDVFNPCTIAALEMLRNKYRPDAFPKMREDVMELKMAAEKGNATRPGIKMGICGEHGGDPESVKFCHRIGLTYVSCSPYRVPVARLAAAHAALEEEAAAAKAAAKKK